MAADRSQERTALKNHIYPERHDPADTMSDKHVCPSCGTVRKSHFICRSCNNESVETLVPTSGYKIASITFIIIALLNGILSFTYMTRLDASGDDGISICFLYLIGPFFFWMLLAWYYESQGEKRETLAAKNQVMEKKNVQHTKSSDRYCVRCGRAIPFDANVCPYCGHDYR